MIEVLFDLIRQIQRVTIDREYGPIIGTCDISVGKGIFLNFRLNVIVAWNSDWLYIFVMGWNLL